MTVQIAHIGDLHFGGLADVPVVEALERMLPDLRPDAIAIGGDMSQRARHGEFQRGRAFANLCRETAPVLVIPGNHDVQWWRRPFIPFGKDAVYQKYRAYFGADLTPTLTIPGGAVIASALTAHGVAWGSLTARLRDIAVKGHLPRREMERVKAAGLPVREEFSVDCCHANQDKFWVQDPDGVDWEVYVLNHDIEVESMDSSACACAPAVAQPTLKNSLTVVTSTSCCSS